MGLTFDIKPYILQFKKPAGTSRGTYTEHKVWYIYIYDSNNPEIKGIGECAPLPDLSCDLDNNYENNIKAACQIYINTKKIDYEALRNYPSILFGLETAVISYERGHFALYDTPFSNSKESILINGLIWMGDIVNMLTQVEEKIASGFKCIKLKIGSLSFDNEIQLIKNIRDKYPKELILRVDANGAFKPEEATEKLRLLSQFDIHSIEQPIKQGQWEKMKNLINTSPVPIALDEELIGVNKRADKIELIKYLQPQYIILKPSLHGGISGCNEWIEIAEKFNVNWWITSALESNIGLNAIAQWCSALNNKTFHGLGTGKLYTNNIQMPLKLEGQHLWFINYRRPVNIEGHIFTPEDIFNNKPEDIFKDRNIKPLTDFLKQWYSQSQYIEIQTSGSTGIPKTIKVSKTQMLNSASATCKYFNLKEGDKILLCLSLDYIAGKMMVVRAIQSGLNLNYSPPEGNPLKYTDQSFRLISMVPIQVYNTLQSKTETAKLLKSDILLIGGSALNKDLENQLENMPVNAYVSYGMAETLSHIALRKIQAENKNTHYKPLPDVEISLSESGTLIINAPQITDTTIFTNDLAEIYPDGTFSITGRKDNVIISGGLKFHIEDLESELHSLVNQPFVITSVNDTKFGEIIVLVVDKDINIKAITEHLPEYRIPKIIARINEIPLTNTGKINRLKVKEIIQSGDYTNLYK